MVRAMRTTTCERTRMKASWVTVEQLAAALQMSVVTIRRAYRNGEIPVERIRRMVRFDLHQVKQAMQRNGQDRVPGVRTKTDQRRATGGRSRRRAQPKAPAR